MGGRSKLRLRLKLLRLFFFFFVFLIIFSVIIGISRAGNDKNVQNKENEASVISTLIPQNLETTEKDYKQLEGSLSPELARVTFNRGSTAQDVTSTAQNDFVRNEETLPQKEPQEYIPQVFRTNDNYSSGASFQDRIQLLQNLLSRKNGARSTGQNTSYVEQGRKSTLFVSAGGGAQNSLSNSLGLPAEIGGVASQLVQFPEQKSQYELQNSQESKKDFLQSRQSRTKDFSSADSYTTLDTHSTIVAGSTIPVVLLTEINSDLPGSITGRVVEDVYDSFQGLNVLIPKGSLLVGSYDSQISWGQLRVLVVWERLTRPDGVALNLPGLQGVDDRGSSGIVSGVKTNIGASLGVAVLSSLFQLGVEYGVSYAYNSTGNKPFSDALRSSSASTLSSTTELANKLLERQPTLSVKQGTVSLVFVHRDLELPPFLR